MEYQKIANLLDYASSNQPNSKQNSNSKQMIHHQINQIQNKKLG